MTVRTLKSARSGAARASAARRPSGRRLDAYLLDVGQGDCTVILPPESDPIVFDIADAHVARMFFLNRETAIHRIAAVIFSHLDSDHIAGGVDFLASFLDEQRGTIGSVYLDTDRPVRDEDPDALKARRLIDFVLARFGQGASIQAPRAQAAPILSGPGWNVRILAPTQGLKLAIERGLVPPSHNLHSALLRVEFGGRALLIGGDALLPAWAALDPTARSADAVRISHHGGALDESGTPAGWGADRLYQEIGPRFGVISVGTHNAHEHPRRDWVDPLFRTAGCLAVCTQVTPRCEPALASDPILAETLIRDSMGWAEEAEPAWRHRRDRRAPRGRAEVACAGSVRISLFENGHVTMVPGRSSHQQDAFIPQLGQPLCRAGAG